MNAEQRAHLREWIADLRSGEYDQATGALRERHGYCCLGVACDRFTNEADADSGWDGPIFVYGPYSAATMPPDMVLDYFGITQAEADDLANANDNGATFAEIAERLERRLMIAERRAEARAAANAS